MIFRIDITTTDSPDPTGQSFRRQIAELGLVVWLHRAQRDVLSVDDLVDQAARLMPIARSRLFSDSNAYVRISLSVCPYSVM